MGVERPDLPPEADALAARVAAADRGEQFAQHEPAPGAPAAPDLAAPWREAAVYYLRMARSMVPEHIALKWTDELLDQFGAALGRYAVHKRWDFGEQFNNPLIGVMIAALPLVWPIVEPYIVPRVKAIAEKRAAPAAHDELRARAEEAAKEKAREAAEVARRGVPAIEDAPRPPAGG